VHPKSVLRATLALLPVRDPAPSTAMRLRDLSALERRYFIAGLVLVAVICTANYYLGLGIFASNAKGTMILSIVLAVVLTAYLALVPAAPPRGSDDRDDA
jgi:hypothetical protein